MWKKYFGPHAQIVGIDIDDSCAAYEEDQIAVRIGDQSDVKFFEFIIGEFRNPDIVIDDGSHQMQHIRTSFEYLYPLVDSTGVYFVEDLQTACWPEYGGGVGRSGTFIEFAKLLIDELHVEWARGQLSPSDFTKCTLSMHFYNSCLVFEKGRHLQKCTPQFGK